MTRSAKTILVIAIAGFVNAPAPSHGETERPLPPAVRLAHAIRDGATAGEVMTIRAQLLVAPGPFPADVSRHPAPTGDLDGDGLDDIVTIEPAGPPEAEQSLLRARRGTDGSQLWFTSIQGFTTFAVDDLDADGAAEIAIFENIASDVPGPLSSTPGVTQNVRVLEGRDGSLVWERPVPGLIVPAAFGEARVTAMEGIVVSFETIPDADGDGSRDVAVGSVTTREVRTPHVPQMPPAPTGVGSVERRMTVFTLDVLSGPSGAPAGRASAAGAFSQDCTPNGSCTRTGGMPWLLATPDMSGDGLADAAALVYATKDASLRGLRLDGGPELWSVPISTTPGAVLWRAQLDGSGGADVILTLYDRGAISVAGYRGTDGAELWSRSLVDEYGWFLLRDADGDGGEEVGITTLASFVHEVRFTALRGATGAELWSSAHGGKKFFDVVRWGPSRDLTGDGVVDVPVDVLVNGLRGDPTSVTAMVVSGRDGSVVWTETRADRTIPSPVNGDVNGNGTSDLVSSSRAGNVVRVRLEDGATGDDLWGADLPSANLDDRLWVWFGADLVAGGGDEVVVSLFSFEAFRQRPYALGPAGVLWTL